MVTNLQIIDKLRDDGLDEDQWIAISQPSPGNARVWVAGASPQISSGIKVQNEDCTVTFIPDSKMPSILSLHDAKPSVEEEREDRWTQIPPGVSCGHKKVTAGTTGFMFEDGYVGSNAHVFSPVNWKPGDDLFQPGVADGGSDNDVYAKLAYSRMQPMWRDITELKWDYAIGKLTGIRRYLVTPLHINPPKGVRLPVVGEDVVKSGRTTAVTNSKVTDINVDVKVNYGGFIIIVRGCTFYQPVFSQGGDSGSPILGLDDFAIDALFAGSEEYTIGIGDLPGCFEAFGVTPVLKDIDDRHDWRLDGEVDVDVPIKPADLDKFFRCESITFIPENPASRSKVSVRIEMTRLTYQKRWCRMELINRDTGDVVLDEIERFIGISSVEYELDTPKSAGAWPLQLRWYWDYNDVVYD